MLKMLVLFLVSGQAYAELPAVTTVQYDSGKLVSFIAKNRAKLANWNDAAVVSDADVARIKAEFCKELAITPCNVKFTTKGNSAIATGAFVFDRDGHEVVVDVPSGKGFTYLNSTDPDLAGQLRVCTDSAGGVTNRVVRVRRSKPEGGTEIALLQFPSGDFREYQSGIRGFNLTYRVKPGSTGSAIKDNDIPKTFVDDGITKFECLDSGDSRISSLYAGAHASTGAASGSATGSVK